MPKERPVSRMILEDKLFRFLLSMKGMNFKDFYSLYNSKTRELDAESQSTKCSYSGFHGWLTVYGLKFRRIPNFLDLLGYRLVVVPKEAEITLQCPTSAGKLECTLPVPEDSNVGVQVAALDMSQQVICTDQLYSPYTLTLRHRSPRTKKG